MTNRNTKQFTKEQLEVKVYNLRIELEENPKHKYAKEMYENLKYYEGLLELPDIQPVDDPTGYEEHEQPKKRRGDKFTPKKEASNQRTHRHMLSGKKRSV